MSKKLVFISGSLRKDSYNTAVLRALHKLLPEGVTAEVLKIDAVPLYNEELEAEFPQTALEAKQRIENADAIVIATPEYNRSIPGVLKNFIDWMSRPYGKSSFAGKPVLIVGASMGPIATALAQYHLKQILLYLGAEVIGQPEIYIGTAHEKFNEQGELTDTHTKQHLQKAIDAVLSRI